RRDVSPVRAKRSMCALCAARKRGGTHRSSGLPRISLARYPNMASAAALNSTIRWSRSMVMIASIADRTIASRRAASACPASFIPWLRSGRSADIPRAPCCEEHDSDLAHEPAKAPHGRGAFAIDGSQSEEPEWIFRDRHRDDPGGCCKGGDPGSEADQSR